jgi:ABC-type transporter MlaC component
MRPSRFLIGVLLFLCVLFRAPPILASEESEAIALVGRLYRSAVDARSISRNSIDTAGIARKVLGGYWAGASNSDRQEYIELVWQWVEDALVGRIANLRSDDFIVMGARQLGNGDILVATRMTRRNGQVTSVDWRSHRCASGPCVIDLIIDGASVSIQRRDEFAARMRASGNSISEVITSIRASPRPSVGSRP